MNKMLIKTTLSNLFTVLCVVIVIVGLISVVSVMMGLRPFVMISESMHPEVPRNALVLLDTRSNVPDVEVGDNVGYVLGKVVAMHKTTRVSSDDSGNVDEIVVNSLADDGETTVTASTYLGKEVLHIPGVGGWIRKALEYKWIVIVTAGLLIIAGCIPRKAQKKA